MRARPTKGLSLPDLVEAFEKSLIALALLYADGSPKVAAELLRIKRTTLVMKMKRYRLDEAGAQEGP